MAAGRKAPRKKASAPSFDSIIEAGKCPRPLQLDLGQILF